MSRAEARWLAADRLQEIREQVDHRDLLAAEGKETRRGRDGKPYSVQTQTWVEDAEAGEIRVMVSVDDGGWSAWVPVSDDFIATARPQDGGLNR